jgi:hypothetical protein
MELLGIGMRARLLELHHRIGVGDLARSDVTDLLAMLDVCHPADTYLAEVWWIAFRAFKALGDENAAHAAIQRGHAWIAERAQHHVPDAFRSAFLERNPINRELLAASGRLGLQVPVPVTVQ